MQLSSAKNVNVFNPIPHIIICCDTTPCYLLNNYLQFSFLISSIQLLYFKCYPIILNQWKTYKTYQTMSIASFDFFCVITIQKRFLYMNAWFNYVFKQLEQFSSIYIFTYIYYMQPNS